nr:MAG TPA: DNA primase [Caudoviricetes sp.]
MLDIAAIKSSITDDAIITLMDSMGIPLVSANSQYQLYPSACHHSDWERHKNKLYYYVQSQRWHCYSCTGDWDTIGLVQHLRKCTFNQAIDYICSTLSINATELDIRQDVDNWQCDLRRWLPNADYDEPAELTAYDPAILAAFDHLYPTDWLEYGITRDSMDKFGIGWYGRQACISIPVMMNGQLVGVRGRYTRRQDVDKGKYRPLSLLDGTVLKFPSSGCLYGLDQNKSVIEKSRQVLLFESEKSVLKAPSYGINNALAVFGSNISKRHIEMLLALGVNDVVLCFDSDYRQVGDDDFKFFVAKMKKLASKLRPYFSTSIVYNNQGYDAYKCNIMDLPYDKAMKLYESRAIIS